jgi:hypothetical protein
VADWRGNTYQVKEQEIDIIVSNSGSTVGRKSFWLALCACLLAGTCVGILVGKFGFGSSEELDDENRKILVPNTYVYSGKDSDWYSVYLISDGKGLPTSYDKMYRNSYSYISANNVRQWNYQTNSWSYTYGYVAPNPKYVNESYIYTGRDSYWYS